MARLTKTMLNYICLFRRYANTETGRVIVNWYTVNHEPRQRDLVSTSVRKLEITATPTTIKIHQYQNGSWLPQTAQVLIRDNNIVIETQHQRPHRHWHTIYLISARAEDDNSHG